jgi:hypothetical protein
MRRADEVEEGVRSVAVVWLQGIPIDRPGSGRELGLRSGSYERGDLVAAAKEVGDDGAADVAGSSGDENAFHEWMIRELGVGWIASSEGFNTSHL